MSLPESCRPCSRHQRCCLLLTDGVMAALQALQEEFRPDMTLKEAEVLALSTLKQVMEEKVRCCGRGAGYEATVVITIEQGYL